MLYVYKYCHRIGPIQKLIVLFIFPDYQEYAIRIRKTWASSDGAQNLRNGRGVEGNYRFCAIYCHFIEYNAFITYIINTKWFRLFIYLGILTINLFTYIWLLFLFIKCKSEGRKCAIRIYFRNQFHLYFFYHIFICFHRGHVINVKIGVEMFEIACYLDDMIFFLQGGVCHLL